MKIVMDEKIPFLGDALLSMGNTVVTLPGAKISRGDVQDADALFVRTRTCCNADLLSGTNVALVGTATIGYDHIDSEFCAQNNIHWVSAPGCNADAVLQYVQSSIYSWVADNKKDIRELTLGVVGVGAIGSRVAAWAASVGFRVLLNDPPREAAGHTGFVPLESIAQNADIITFHPTLNRECRYSTYHLADEAFFLSLRRLPLIINASRGPVVDNMALLHALDDNLVSDAIVDVWENEPDINLQLLDRAYIATPHIAGYSAEGKLNASRMMLEAFVSFFGCKGDIPQLTLQSPDNHIVAADNLANALLAIYSPLDDSKRLKGSPFTFENQRNNYTLRREPSAFDIVLR